jgi:hypothetical protein
MNIFQQTIKAAFYVVLVLSSYAQASQAHVVFEDTCLSEPATVVLSSWLSSTKERSSSRGVTRYKTLPPRVRAQIHIQDLNAEEDFYVKVEAIEHSEPDHSSRIIKTLYEKWHSPSRRTHWSKVLSISGLPLTYRADKGRLSLRATWIQGTQGGVRESSLLWHDEAEDYFQLESAPVCFWQGPAQLRSSYKFNGTRGIKSLTETTFLLRNYGDFRGLDVGVSAAEFGSYYQLINNNYSSNEINLLQWDRPLQGLIPGGVAAWLSVSSQTTEFRQDTLSLFQTYILGPGEGGFYVGRRVYSRHKARRFCFSRVKGCTAWRMCDQGFLDTGFLQKGFTVVPADIVHSSVAVMNFIEMWNNLQDTCKENAKNSNQYEFISQKQKVVEADEQPHLYFKTGF